MSKITYHADYLSTMQGGMVHNMTQNLTAGELRKVRELEMNQPVTLEICVDSPQSAIAAARGGAHRIELCSSLLEGGITPSAGLIAAVRDRVSIPIFVMIRPRGGDFCYSDEEFVVMKQDIAAAKNLKADGIVFGILTEDGDVDVRRCQELLHLARPLNATFHRAFDMSRDLARSLEDIITAGFDRVLTSGGAQKVQDAIPIVAQLCRHASGRIALMIGAGVSSKNVVELVSQTGVREVHTSARRVEPSPMRFHNDAVILGALPGCEYQRAIVDEEEVRNLIQALQLRC